MARRTTILILSTAMLTLGQRCPDPNCQPCQGPGLCTDVKYTLSGGIAGHLDTVTVHPDGTVIVSNPVIGDRIGTLTPDQLQRIVDLLANWCNLRTVDDVGGCCDLLFHSLEYNGRVQSWDDLTRNLPTEIGELAGELQRINIAITSGV